MEVGNGLVSSWSWGVVGRKEEEGIEESRKRKREEGRVEYTERGRVGGSLRW